jgi:tryptophan synthase alpha chain
VRAIAHAGADAIEIDLATRSGRPVIQAASEKALAAGATPHGILDELSRVDAGVPLAVMTYYNIAFRTGLQRFAENVAASGAAAAIPPDLPLEEVGPVSQRRRGRRGDRAVGRADGTRRAAARVCAARACGFVLRGGAARRDGGAR